MATTVIRVTLPDMLKRFEALGPLMVETVYTSMQLTAQRMVRDVTVKRLSGPRGAPGILGLVTHHARNTMTGFTTVEGNTISAVLGSPVDYVKTHEQGFHGIVNVRAHERRRLGAIKAVSIAKATFGKVIKRGKPTAAQLRAGSIHVRQHARNANIVAKHFIRDTVLAAKGPTENRILKGLNIAWTTGKAPTSGQLGA